MLKYYFLSPYKNIFNTKKRSNRTEFIIFNICFFLVFYCLLGTSAFFFNQSLHVTALLNFIFLFCSIIPYTTLVVRRLHDINFNSYWLLISIPLSIIGIIIEIKTNHEMFFKMVMGYLMLLHFFLMFFKGTPGPNKYGPPPEY